MAALRAFELYRFFHTGEDETIALRGVDISLEPGEFVALVGPSGSGKSTLLSCLAGIDEPDGGHVEIMGVRLTRRPEPERARLRARHIGLMMQSNNLFEHLTVNGNIRLQIRLAGKSRAPVPSQLLDELGLAGAGAALPSQLSGGEAARAALAVALSANPDVLICDEPTAEVDAETEGRILERLASVCHSGRSVLIATHSGALAQRSDRIVRLSDGRLAHA